MFVGMHALPFSNGDHTKESVDANVGPSAWMDWIVAMVPNTTIA